MPTDHFRIAWAIWGAIVVLGFTFLETWAIVDKEKGDTLTESLRPLLSSPHSPQWWVAVALVVWAAYHLLFYWVAPRIH